MSKPAYCLGMAEKLLVKLGAEIKTPPLSSDARTTAGALLRRLQKGEILQMPDSRPLPSIGRDVHELRIRDGARDWRVIYRIDRDAILLVSVFAKKTQQTPQREIQRARMRIQAYDEATKHGG